MKSLLLLSSITSLLFPALSNAAATVYLRPSGTQLGKLSAPEADVLLAHHLGLESTASLSNEDLESLLESAGGQTSLGRELLDSADDSLLLVVDASLADVQQLIPDSWASPSFTSTMSPLSLESMLGTYSSKAAQSDFTVYTNPELSSTGSFAHHRLLDMFDFAGDSQAAESFVKTFDALVEFIERTDLSTRRFGAFHLSALPALEQQYGRGTDAYSAMVLAVKAALSNPSLEQSNVAVIFSTPDTNADRTRRDLSAGMTQATQAPLPIPPGNAPIFSSSTCFASADACQDGTTECSGRGQCIPVKKGPRECFVCQCAVTKDSKNRTEYWSGASCQNKDVSMAFTMLAGTTIAIVLVIAFSISLLYSIGTQELPNVLTGGIVHAKHD